MEALKIIVMLCATANPTVKVDNNTMFQISNYMKDQCVQFHTRCLTRKLKGSFDWTEHVIAKKLADCMKERSSVREMRKAKERFGDFSD